MKKLGKYFILIAIVLVCALINTIVFLTIDDARLDTKVFWLVWAFATRRDASCPPPRTETV